MELQNNSILETNSQEHIEMMLSHWKIVEEDAARQQEYASRQYKLYKEKLAELVISKGEEQ